MTFIPISTSIDQLKLLLVLLAASSFIIVPNEALADDYSSAVHQCYQTWDCDYSPKTRCCAQYCALTSCTQTTPYDSAATACSPQLNAYFVCMRNSHRDHPASTAQESQRSGRWVTVRNAGIPGYNTKIIKNISISNCKQKCIEYSWCKSVDYERKVSQCFMQPVNKFDVQLKNNYPKNPYDHHSFVEH